MIPWSRIGYRGSKGSPGLVVSRINNLWERDMKIIGTINSQDFLAEISAQEIDFLAGKRIGTIEGRYDHIRAIPTGTTFNIVKAFDQIYRNDRRKSEVESLRATLKAILVGLDMIEPLIEEPKPPEEKPAEAA